MSETEFKMICEDGTTWSMDGIKYHQDPQAFWMKAKRKHAERVDLLVNGQLFGFILNEDFDTQIKNWGKIIAKRS